MGHAGAGDPAVAMKPVVTLGGNLGSLAEATGQSFAIREWAGSGPAELHVHHADDEAWHVLTGALRFRFVDSEVDAQEGSTVFVPAGVAHTFVALTPETRYLIILTQRLLSLIESLSGDQDHERTSEIYRAHESELVD